MPPKPWVQRRASTCFMRVPAVDWPRIILGQKTEFRMRPVETSQLLAVHRPTPVVAYCWNRSGGHRSAMMVLEDLRYEPLFEITANPESLAAEGFDSYDAFRSYWRQRLRAKFRPMELVWVHRVRLWTAEDREKMGGVLIDHLYEGHV